jgi:hydroxymethylbilane synthase
MDRPAHTLRLGTRGSALALAQARQVAAAIVAAHGWPDEAVEIVAVKTTGDRVQDRPLAEIGGKGLWTKELDRALMAGEVDFCVHSMKDVESERPPALTIAAMRPRADVRDRLIGAPSIDALKRGAVFGTSSPRRAAQILRLRPDLKVIAIRGNVETRLRKVAEGEVDATLLAAAGLDRLGLDAGVAISSALILPAPGQAAIGIECRSDDDAVMSLLSPVSDPDTFDCVSAERAFTRALGATCSSPVAALAVIDAGLIRLCAQIFSSDGHEIVEDETRIGRGDLESAEALARSMLEAAPAKIRTLFEAA